MGLYFVGTAGKATAPMTEITDTATIQSSVQLSHLSIATSENFARQRIYVIPHIEELATKPLRTAEVKMRLPISTARPFTITARRSSTRTINQCLPASSFVSKYDRKTCRAVGITAYR
jgi:hypothetical protein